MITPANKKQFRIYINDLDVTRVFTAADPDGGWVEFELPEHGTVRFHGEVKLVVDLYKCRRCGLMFTSARDWSFHIVSPHQSVN